MERRARLLATGVKLRGRKSLRDYLEQNVWPLIPSSELGWNHDSRRAKPYPRLWSRWLLTMVLDRSHSVAGLPHGYYAGLVAVPEGPAAKESAAPCEERQTINDIGKPTRQERIITPVIKSPAEIGRLGIIERGKTTPFMKA
jgi:hypothetical protein